MTDPNLRCQVTALPSIPDGTCISDVTTDMADVILSTAVEMAPRSKRPLGAQCWSVGPGVETERSAAWQQRSEEASTRRTPQQQPSKGREDG